MAAQLLLNIVFAFFWMLLSSNWTLSHLMIGYGIGLILLFICRPFLKNRFYFGRVLAVLYLIFLFLYELWKANVDVVKHALKPKLTMQPAFFAYETTLTENWQITLLSCLITLTPGTIVVHISDDQKMLYIHALDAEDMDEAVVSIKQSFEKAILEVSRT